MIDWGTWGTILGSIAGILGGIRWLLSVYFKQQEKLEKLKDSLFAKRIDSLDVMVKQLKIMLGEFEVRMKAVEASFGKASLEMEETKAGFGSLLSSLRAFIAKTDRQFEAVEEKFASGRVVKVGHDTYIFKSDHKKKIP